MGHEGECYFEMEMRDPFDPRNFVAQPRPVEFGAVGVRGSEMFNRAFGIVTEQQSAQEPLAGMIEQVDVSGASQETVLIAA